MIKKITDSEFKQSVLENKNVCIVMFASNWSGSAMLVENHIRKITKPHNGLVSTFKMNIEKNSKVIEEFSLYRFPTTLFFLNGELVDMLNGLFSKKNLDDVVNNILNKF